MTTKLSIPDDIRELERQNGLLRECIDGLDITERGTRQDCPEYVREQLRMAIDGVRWALKTEDMRTLESDLLEKVVALEEELKLWKPMTPEEADAAYEAAEAVPISDAEIEAIVERITDPAYQPSEPEYVKLVAKVRQQQKFIDEVQAALASEGQQTIEHLLACAKLGELTTVIGRSRLKQLHEAERRVRTLEFLEEDDLAGQ